MYLTGYAYKTISEEKAKSMIPGDISKIAYVDLKNLSTTSEDLRNSVLGAIVTSGEDNIMEYAAPSSVTSMFALKVIDDLSKVTLIDNCATILNYQKTYTPLKNSGIGGAIASSGLKDNNVLSFYILKCSSDAVAPGAAPDRTIIGNIKAKITQ